MIDSTYWKVTSLLMIGFLVLGLSSAALKPTAAAPEAPLATQGPTVVVRADYSGSTLRVPPPAASLLGGESATISVNYSGSWTSEAQAAFQYAVDIWETQINSSVPIVVHASWESLGSGILGSAGAYSWHRDFSGAPVSGTWYPAGLASALADFDVNDIDGSDHDGDGGDVDAEIRVRLNSDFPDWYFGTDGNTPSDKWDMATVVLHELCHGLGFAGSMVVDQYGYGSWGYETGYPFIYDRFTENGSGQQLISAFPNNSTDLATQLQGGDLYFDGLNANAANGGQAPEIFAPSTWMQGSSYSHLDEIFNNTPNALMTYSVSNGESVHAPGPIVLGVYQDIGWPVVQQEYPNVSIEKTVIGSNFQAGDPITFTLSVSNIGDGVASQVMVTDTLPSEVTSPSFASSLAITPVVGSTYVWNVESLAVGESGVITIYGQIDPGLGGGVSFANTATINDPQDETPNNNTSSVLVGQTYTYLPIVLKRYPPVPFTPVLNTVEDPEEDGFFLVDWESADQADSYVLEEDDNASFSSPTERYSGTSTSWHATDKGPGTYYYRVKAVNSWGDSGWSTTRSVTIHSYERIRNAGFESGPEIWTEYSAHGWDVIINDSDFPGSSSPHNGDWGVWLGGGHNEIALIEQRVTIPASEPYLSYWHWINSEDVCGCDFGVVVVDSSTVVDVYTLCNSSNTGGWERHSVDLSDYIGQSILLQIRVETDSSLLSSLLVDDVRLRSSALVMEEHDEPLELPDAPWAREDDPAERQIDTSFPRLLLHHAE